MQPSTGLVLSHRYHLTDRIALGGMGEVWAAEDEVLGRMVAVKMLRPELLEEPGFVARLRAEARHAASLTHVGIAGVYDYVEDETGAFLVMELVPGRPLSDVLAEQRVPPLTTTLSILAQTAEALGAAHSGGVVHRDVKPGNIMVLPDGSVKVTDFGIAKAMESGDSTDHSQPLTMHGQVVGTPQYMSPEQIAGQPATAAADIYALGVIGHEMLRGARPFSGENALALAVAHAHEVPPALPESVPRGVRALIERAMSKRIEDRPPTAAAFAAELRTLQMGLTPAPSTGPATIAEGLPSHAPTGIMPAAGVAVGAPLLVVHEAALDRRRGRHRAVQPAAHRSTRRLATAALVMLAGVAAVVLVLRLDSNGGPGRLGALAAAATSSTILGDPATTAIVATTLPSAPVQVTPATVVVDPQALIGLSIDDATKALQVLGMEVDTNPVASEQPAGTVLDVSPSGALTPGTHVTLSVSTGPGARDGGKGKGKGKG